MKTVCVDFFLFDRFELTSNLAQFSPAHVIIEISPKIIFPKSIFYQKPYRL